MLRLRSALATLAAAAVLGIAACDLSTDTGAIDVDPRDLVYAPALGVDFTQMQVTPEGLYYQNLPAAGPEGEVIQPNDSLTVNYKLWLPNGTLMDSHESATGVKVDLRGVIAGWQIGVPGMREGGRRKLVVPPTLGYGSVNWNGIPANSVLVFDVTVVSRLTP